MMKLESLSQPVQDVINGLAAYDALSEDEKNELFYFFYPKRKEESEQAYKQYTADAKEYKQIVRLYGYAIAGSFAFPVAIWGLMVSFSLKHSDNTIISRKVYFPILLMSLSLLMQLILFVFFMLNVYANFQSGNVGNSTYLYIFAVDFLFALAATTGMVFSAIKFNTLDRFLAFRKINVKTKNMVNPKYWTDIAVDKGFKKANQIRQNNINKREKRNAQNN